MAEKKKNKSFDEIMRDIKSGIFSPIYILMGAEAYYIDKIADCIAENALAPEERDFNQDVVFGADVNVAQIVDMAKGYPMLSIFTGSRPKRSSISIFLIWLTLTSPLVS